MVLMQQWEAGLISMKKIISLLFIGLLLSNCSYTPLINPETSRDKFNGNNIAGNYWKDLHACRYIFEQNHKMFLRGHDLQFIQKCMESYGYTVLR